MQLWSKTLNRNVFVAKIDCGGASDPLVDQSPTSVLYWNPDDNKWEWAYIGRFEPPHEPETAPQKMQVEKVPSPNDKEFCVIFKTRHGTGGLYIKASNLGDLLRELTKCFHKGDDKDFFLGSLASLTVSFGEMRYCWEKGMRQFEEWSTIADGVSRTFKEVF